MTTEQIKKKVLMYKDWEWWAERPFCAFIMSTFVGGQSREYMKKIGLNAEWPVTLFQNGCFYKSQTVWGMFARQLQSQLHNDRLAFIISKNCEGYLKASRKKVANLLKSKQPLQEKIQEFYELLTPVSSFIWTTHGLEHYYRGILEKEVPKYFKRDVNKYIGDISFPVKHNAHYYFEQALRGNGSLRDIQNKYAWIKIRDGFSEGFSLQELSQERKRLKLVQPQKFKRPKIAKPLVKYAKIAQEIVYQRTLRTDVLFELLYLARPLLKQIAKRHSIRFSDLRYYSLYDLARGKVRRYAKFVTYVSYGKDHAFINKPLFTEKKSNQTIINGVIANKGYAKGLVKIVKIAHEIGKVNKGDILVAPTTFPSFIMGMKKASAFVTDEGGITSHAAIVSREMGKPCVIGTKIATKVFKDGDLVEVDANKGIVRKIK